MTAADLLRSSGIPEGTLLQDTPKQALLPGREQRAAVKREIAKRKADRKRLAATEYAKRIADIPELADGRPARPQGIRVPARVEIKDGHLLYDYQGRLGTKPSFSSADPQIITDFSHISRSAPSTIGKAICDFAKRYGVIQATPVHGGVADTRTTVRLEDGTAWQVGQTITLMNGGREPIALWLKLSNSIRAMLDIHNALRGRTKRYDQFAGEDRSQPTPDVLESDSSWMAIGEVEPNLEHADRLLCEHVNRWLLLGRVHPRLEITKPASPKSLAQWGYYVNYNHLIGGIAHALSLHVLDAEKRLFLCDSCHRFYVRHDLRGVKKSARKDGSQMENFCEECRGRKEAVRRAKARNRPPKKETVQK